MSGHRDIAELDDLAHEIKVCLEKADNYQVTAKQKIATVLPAFARGEFGKGPFGNGTTWTPTDWLQLKVFAGRPYFYSTMRILLPRPREYAKMVIEANPHLSDRAIAAQIGVDHKTVSAARTGEKSPVEKRVGLDGKERRMPARGAHDPIVDDDDLGTLKLLFLRLSASRRHEFDQWRSTVA